MDQVHYLHLFTSPWVCWWGVIAGLRIIYSKGLLKLFKVEVFILLFSFPLINLAFSQGQEADLLPFLFCLTRRLVSSCLFLDPVHLLVVFSGLMTFLILLYTFPTHFSKLYCLPLLSQELSQLFSFSFPFKFFYLYLHYYFLDVLGWDHLISLKNLCLILIEFVIL